MARVGGWRGRSGGYGGATGAGGREAGTPGYKATAEDARRTADLIKKLADESAKRWPMKDALAQARTNAARGKGTGRNLAPMFLRMFKNGPVRLGGVGRARKSGPNAGRLG